MLILLSLLGGLPSLAAANKRLQPKGSRKVHSKRKLAEGAPIACRAWVGWEKVETAVGILLLGLYAGGGWFGCHHSKRQQQHKVTKWMKGLRERREASTKLLVDRASVGPAHTIMALGLYAGGGPAIVVLVHFPLGGCIRFRECHKHRKSFFLQSGLMSRLSQIRDRPLAGKAQIFGMDEIHNQH